MKLPNFVKGGSFWLCLLVVLIAVGVSGCASTEPENASSKPWNSPEGWQGSALPGMLPPR